MQWFNKQSRLVQVILLLIPIVNWVTEIYVRVTAVLTKPTFGNILGVILAIVVPFWGWIDLISVLLFKHLCLAN